MRALDGAVVAVTGGARGIGLATAAALSERGARVHIGDLDVELARAEADRLGLAGAHPLDVADTGSFAAFLDAVHADGTIAALVNNAGVMPFRAFLEEDDAASARTVAVNLTGVITGMRLALPEMVERGSGHIVNVASLAARFPVPGSAVYSGTKAAVVAMTDAVRRELAGTGVELTTVLPTMVATDLTAGAPEGRGLHAVEPEDVAGTIVRALEGSGGTAVAGPWWLDPVSRVVAVLPRAVEDLARSALGDRRLLTSLDAEARAEYEARLAERSE